jgi:hypothetical protein
LLNDCAFPLLRYRESATVWWGIGESGILFTVTSGQL